jgi:hypothetical protein
MSKLSELEKLKLKSKLTEKIEEFINTVTSKDNNLGWLPWLPENIESLMSNAAFEILLTAVATSEYMEEQDLLK